MAGEASKLKYHVIPPPIDGINLISSQMQFKETEARDIKNYWIYDSGIRQMPDVTANKTYSGSNSNVQILTSYTSPMFFATQLKLYKITSATSTIPTDVTGAATITQASWNPCIFNKRLFLFNGVDAPLQHDFGAGNFTAFSATGPTLANLKQACGFKSRMYIIDIAATTYWYGAVDAFAGTFTQVDLGSIISLPNSKLLCVFPWTFNQGFNNEEFLVFLTDQGEALIYSGDYPGSANWALVGRSFLPIPAGAGVNSAGQPFYRIANDTYVMTARGLIPMSTIFAGQAITDGYYTISRNIKNQLQSSIVNTISVDRNNPFLYALSSVNQAQLYVMNYERGAWSLYAPTIPSGEVLISTGFFGAYLMISTGKVAGTAGGLYYMNTAGTAASTLTYTWKTPFFDFGAALQKKVELVRVLGLNYGNSSVFKNTVSVSTEFVDPASPSTDTTSTNVAADTETFQELAPPGLGRRVSLNFTRVGVDGINECNEIQGVEMYYTEGGCY